MRVALIGSELEENLAMRSIHASVVQAGHTAAIFDFHARKQIPALVPLIRTYAPDLVGLSMVFTIRGREFVALAESLRSAGFTGHITAGGHFASFHAEPLLRDVSAFDSIVHGEGEEPLVDLLANLNAPGVVDGISYRDSEGEIQHTPLRRHPDDLDARPWPTRPARLHAYLGFPIANVLSGRGCPANCHFCSLDAWYRRHPGRRFRQRHPERIAGEMAELYHERGVRIFNFHDDNFFCPNHRQNLARFRTLTRELHHHKVGRIAIQVKARPDSLRGDVVDSLEELGLFRVFLGVENNAARGLEALGRGIRREENHRALRLLLDRGLHVSFNLLMFEPNATTSDLRDNVEFIRQYAEVPLNFGRVEVVAGTVLEKRLRAAKRLLGDYFGYTYRLADPASDRAYKIFRAVFLPRNFSAEAMNLKAMQLDYLYHVLKHFHARRADEDLQRKVKGRIRELNEHSVQLLEEILKLAETGRCSGDGETGRIRSRHAGTYGRPDRGDRRACRRPRVEEAL